MPDYDTLTTIASYWTIFVWFVGIVCLTLLGLLAVNHLAWMTYRHIVGWPVILRALREYRDRRAGEAPAEEHR